MTKLEVIELVAIGIAVVAFLVWFIIKTVKNKWLSGIIDTINEAIKEAESSGKSGIEKKAYVLQKVEQKCNELKVPYKLLFGLISKLIDTTVKHYNVIAK